MQTSYLSLSPRYNPGYLVIPDAGRAIDPARLRATLPIVGRHISQDYWCPTVTPPTPESMQAWEYISEPCWVARCLLNTLDKSINAVVSRELEQISPESHEDIAQLFFDLIEQCGSTGGWAVGLAVCARDTHTELAQGLLDHLCSEHGAQAPSLGGWANYVALLGNTSSLRQSENDAPDYPRLLERMRHVTPTKQLGRMLADMQIYYDNGSEMFAALSKSGLGAYHWQWASPGMSNPHGVPLCFLDARNAIEWLCESLIPAGLPDGAMYSNPRRRLRPLRDMIREGQLALINTTSATPISPLEVITLLDDQSTPAGADRVSA